MTNKSFLFSSEPKWHEHRKGSHHSLPDAVLSWAYEAGSLTQRLRHFYGDNIKVSLLLQQWHKPYLDERILLELPLHRYGLVREVLLHCDHKPLLLARTIIPEETIKVAHRNLAHLGTRPLGEVIFSYPDLERVAMDLCLVKPTAWTETARQTAKITEPVWGRRTVYAIQKRPMLISEFFLPEILAH